MPAPVQSKSEPKVAENIIFATSPQEAKAIADSIGVPFDQVQWFRNADLLGDADVSEKKVHFSAAFTHRQDYADVRDRVKRGKGARRG
jgi:hypothetical protein